MAKKFYVTNAIPYVNAAPHLGHALEFVQTDVVARYRRLSGEDVFYLSGADENALKNVLAAEKAGLPAKDFVDGNTKKFEDLKKTLNLSYDDFIRTSDKERHWAGAQKLWTECDKNGDIYEKEYEGLYCVGCEEFKTEKDLVDDHCPEHKDDLQTVKERNYFFRLSKYQNKLQNLIESDELKIIPESRKNEISSFIRGGLEDFSISRSKERARGWGIPVPGDESQIIYVWFDALANYITALGYGRSDIRLPTSDFRLFWPADLHIIGKGITRFHAIYWPAMLLSAGIALPKAIFVHGYLTVEGQKISKSLGNVIDPFELARKYGADAVRYYLLKVIPATGDGDFSRERFESIYNSDLANGLGNLVSRVAKLCEHSRFDLPLSQDEYALTYQLTRNPSVKEALDAYNFHVALGHIEQKIALSDADIARRAPWLLEGEALSDVLKILVGNIREIAALLGPFIPETAELIQEQFKGPQVRSRKPLFPRLAL